jgi:hypothetical protein
MTSFFSFFSSQKNLPFLQRPRVLIQHHLQVLSFEKKQQNNQSSLKNDINLNKSVIIFQKIPPHG